MFAPACLLPFSDLGLDTVEVVTDQIRITLTATRRAVPCPVCAHVTTRIHSHYSRTLADLPWAGCRVHLALHVRKFFCPNSACGRRIFTERLLTAPAYARRTQRLTHLLRDLVLQVGGQTGARLAHQAALPTSARSLLRLAQATPVAPFFPPRVIGIDDWVRPVLSKQAYGLGMRG